MQKNVSAAMTAASLSLCLFSSTAVYGHGLDSPKRPVETASVDPTTTGSIGETDDDAKTALDNPYAKLITRYANKFGVSVDLANAVVRIESNYNPKARGSAGEIGLMQIKPATARMMGYSGPQSGLFNPETNIRYGMKYLAAAQDIGDGTTCGTILKYNAGHGAEHMNPVSKRYCGRVLSVLDGA